MEKSKLPTVETQMMIRKPDLEKGLEKKLIRHMEDFLLEFGKGFMFVGSQQRIAIYHTPL